MLEEFENINLKNNKDYLVTHKTNVNSRLKSQTVGSVATQLTIIIQCIMYINPVVPRKFECFL